MGCSWKCKSPTWNPLSSPDSQSDSTFQGYFQLFFWFAMLIGLFSPLTFYYTALSYFPIWPVIHRFFILFTVNCSWLTLISPIGYFLLQGKVLNKPICAVYSICLCIVIVAAMVSIAFVQSQDVSKIELDDPNSEASILTGIKDYFNEKGDIPMWLQELQSQQKCCGFSGPEDWKLRIYPADKPAIEDVPESCCITKVVGCNLVLQYFRNKTDLKRWVYTDGCRKTIEHRLSALLTNISIGCLIIMVVGICLVTIYWCQLVDFTKQNSPDSDTQEKKSVKNGSEAQDCEQQQVFFLNTGSNINFDDTNENYCDSGSPGPGSNFASGINSNAFPSQRSSSVLQKYPSNLATTLRSVQFAISSRDKVKSKNNGLQFQVLTPAQVRKESKPTSTSTSVKVKDLGRPSKDIKMQLQFQAKRNRTRAQPKIGKPEPDDEINATDTDEEDMEQLLAGPETWDPDDDTDPGDTINTETEVLVPVTTSSKSKTRTGTAGAGGSQSPSRNKRSSRSQSMRRINSRNINANVDLKNFTTRPPVLIVGSSRSSINLNRPISKTRKYVMGKYVPE